MSLHDIPPPLPPRNKLDHPEKEKTIENEKTEEKKVKDEKDNEVHYEEARKYCENGEIVESSNNFFICCNSDKCTCYFEFEN